MGTEACELTDQYEKRRSLVTCFEAQSRDQE